jgi:bacterioferritin-associated ferredoxin
MNDNGPDKKNVICYCSGTTEEKIKELIDNNIANLDGISRKTGACSGCGACETLILELIAEYSLIAINSCNSHIIHLELK